MRLTKRKLEEFRERCYKIIATWKPRLGLSDWQIELQVEKEPRGSTIAWTIYDWTMKKATVGVTAAILTHKYDFEVDVEESLVHELLHLVLAPVAPDADEDDLVFSTFEQILNTLARALVELSRGCSNA